MPKDTRFVKIDFERFKAFKKFTLKLRHFNILVGPNNAGKSTVLTAFRILAAAFRKANSHKPETVDGPDGSRPCYIVDLRSISVAEENMFYNYDDSRPASVKFYLSNGYSMVLYFPSHGVCYLIVQGEYQITTPTTFKKYCGCKIGFVPILGPVDHDERLYEKETARQSLYNYTAARNFRNIWYHYPERFKEFQEILRRTWPGMDILSPEVNYDAEKPRLHMFCPEERIPREIFWAGFGFQVWCQMLTHVIKSSEDSVFLIDEPDIYLHSELQRQLLVLLRELGPDIIIATHSTQIISDADPDELVVVDKRRSAGKRIKDPTQIADVFALLGSNLNPVLTQIAKTLKVVFVEGKDFQVIGKFAQRCGFDRVASRAGFAVVPVGGFNPQRIANLLQGMESAIGSSIQAAAVLDGDFRSQSERAKIADECRGFCKIASVHSQKEIENFLLVPAAIDRAAKRRLEDRNRRTGGRCEYSFDAARVLDQYAASEKNTLMAKRIHDFNRFGRVEEKGVHDSQLNEKAICEFDKEWSSFEGRMRVVCGKDAIRYFNGYVQRSLGVSVTHTSIIECMHVSEVPPEMLGLIKDLDQFVK